MTLGRRVLSFAVSDLGNAVARDGDLDGARTLMLQLPWADDLDPTFVGELLADAAHEAQVLPPAAALARAELVLTLVARRGPELERAAALGALAVAANAEDAERVVAYGQMALRDRLAAAAPDRYLAECHEWQGRGLSQLGRDDEAAASFATAARAAAAAGAGELEARCRCELAAGLIRRRSPLAAVEEARAAVECAAAGDHMAVLARAHGLLGTAYMHLYRLQQAEGALRAALAAARRVEDRKGQSDWLGNLGIVALERGHYDDAVGYQQEALALSREIGDVESELTDLGNLAAVLDRAGRTEEALPWRVEAVRVAEALEDPEVVAAYRERLRAAYDDAGHYDEAVALNDLLTAEPEEPAAEIDEPGDADAEAFLEDVTARRHRGEDGDSVRAFIDTFRARRPDSYAGPMAAGVLLRAEGRLDEAMAAYRSALDLDPARIEVHNNLLAAAGAAGRLDAEAQRYRALVEADPLDPVLRFGLGCIHNMRGDPDLALRELRESLRLGESSGFARLLLCAALVAKGRVLIQEGPRFDLARWSAAWGHFEECVTEAFQLRGSRVLPTADALATVSDRLVDIAFISHDANPSLLGGMGDRELDVLTDAGRLLMEAGRADPESRAVAERFDRLCRLVQGFGEDAFRDFLHGAAGLRP